MPASRSRTGGFLIRGSRLGRLRAATHRRALVGALAAVALAAPSVHAAPVDETTPRTTMSADSSGGAADRVIAEALRLRGTPYVWAGSTPSGFDCSGFTAYVYAKVGVHMDHSTYAQRAAFPSVDRGDLRRGDLVFFAGAGHVGIYMGAGRFIHSPRSGDVVKVSRLDESWYRTSYAGAVRPTSAT